MLKSVMIFSIFAVALNQTALAQQGNGYRGGNGNQAIGQQSNKSAITDCPIITSTSITPMAAESLAFMREEEKLARDVYRFLGEKWQLRVFTNIANSEERHMASVKCLLDGFQISDSATEVMGQFNNADLQNLYDQLTQRGQTSLVEALRVGALIEEVDIKDLQEALAVIQTPEIAMVYQNLIAGSENHLRAFTRNLTRQGESYTAQVLPPEEVERILANRQPGMAVFDLDHNTLSVPNVQIRQDGQLLPDAGRYDLELKATSGDNLQILQIQKSP